jgi:predicted HAD superfamily Cof-like phosphohydrolase
MNYLQKVESFQLKFGQHVRSRPTEMPASVASLRKKLVLEEATELVLAIDRGELEEQLDACIDLIYVAFGTVNALGMMGVFDEGFDRVHEANMKKVAAPSRHASKRDSAFDIVKPDGWIKPDLSDLVNVEYTVIEEKSV